MNKIGIFFILVKGFVPMVSENKQPVVDLTAQQDQLRDLTQRKQNLLLEIKNYEENTKVSLFFNIFNSSDAINPSRPDFGRREKTNLNFYFHTSLWCHKRFYEGLKCLYKTFSGTTSKFENK